MSFWDACGRHQLLLTVCGDCERYWHMQPQRCPGCHSTQLRSEPVRGAGRIATYTVVHRPPFARFRNAAPYILALVDLDEGARMMAWVDMPVEDVAIGAEVQVHFSDEDPPFRFIPKEAAP